MSLGLSVCSQDTGLYLFRSLGSTQGKPPPLTCAILQSQPSVQPLLKHHSKEFGAFNSQITASIRALGPQAFGWENPLRSPSAG